MKKIFQLTTICLVLCALASCGKNPEEELLSIKIKTPDRVKYTSYQEACAVYDFQAAHQYLAKMKNMIETYEIKNAKKIDNWSTKAHKRHEAMCSIYDDARSYVYEKEHLYLYSLGNDDAKQRILYLLKEEGEESSRINMLLDLAIENDDVGFVKTLAKQDQVSSSSLQKVVRFLYIERGSEHLDFLTTLLNSKNERDILPKAAIDKDDEQFVVAFAKQYGGTMDIDLVKTFINYLKQKKSTDTNRFFEELALNTNNNSEMLDYAIELKHISVVQKLLEKDKSLINGRVETLASLNDKDISNLIIVNYITNKIGNISNPPLMGKNDAFYSSTAKYFCEKTDNYISQVKEYNKLCFDVINLGIKAKNKYLAQRALSEIKPNVSYTQWNNPNDDHFWYIVSHDNTDIQNATKIFNNASF